MGGFEKRDEDKLEFTRTNLALLIFLFLGIYKLGYDFLDADNDYYEGEKLSSMTITLDDSMEYIND